MKSSSTIESLHFETKKEEGAKVESSGSVEYSVIGEFNPDRNRIIFIGGMGNDFVNLLDVAEMLSEQGETQVAITSQPKYDAEVPGSLKRDPDQAIDFLANAVIDTSREAGFFDDGRPINIVGYSLGGLVLDRVRQIARQDNIQSLLPENGSLAAYVAASGTDAEETVPKLLGRLPRYMVKGMLEASVMDPEKVKGKAVNQNTTSDLNKSWGEMMAVGMRSIDRYQAGAIAIVYPKDYMFPQNKKALKGRGFVRGVMENGYPIPVLTPIDSDDKKRINDMVLGSLVHETSSKDKRAVRARTYLKAGHDDPTNNPQRTVRVVLDFFENPGVYLGSQSEQKQ